MYVSDHSEGASSPFVNLTDNHWTHSTHSFQDKPIPVFSITFSSSDFPVSIVFVELLSRDVLLPWRSVSSIHITIFNLSGHIIPSGLLIVDAMCGGIG